MSCFAQKNTAYAVFPSEIPISYTTWLCCAQLDTAYAMLCTDKHGQGRTTNSVYRRSTKIQCSIFPKWQAWWAEPVPSSSAHPKQHQPPSDQAASRRHQSSIPVNPWHLTGDHNQHAARQRLTTGRGPPEQAMQKSSVQNPPIAYPNPDLEIDEPISRTGQAASMASTKSHLLRPQPDDSAAPLICSRSASHQRTAVGSHPIIHTDPSRAAMVVRSPVDPATTA
ncbi:hypothetical protein ACLOJK_026749 [Asimina triloba]